MGCWFAVWQVWLCLVVFGCLVVSVVGFCLGCVLIVRFDCFAVLLVVMFIV